MCEGPKKPLFIITDVLSEWLRSATRNRMGSARVGSNPTNVEQFFFVHTPSHGDSSELLRTVLTAT